MDPKYPDKPRLIVGPGVVDRLGEIVADLGGRRVLLVTDPGVRAACHVDRATRSLSDAAVTIFDEVIENPTDACVDACAAAARGAEVDLIVGFGGGSAMDTAKGANFVLTNGGRIHDYWGIGKATAPLLAMVAVPTTAGTGSECQSFALISDRETHRKMACGDPKALPAVAMLDPELTITQPPTVAANTGIDAISHAVETAVTTRRTDQSFGLSKRAFELMTDTFEVVLTDGENIEARGRMQIGAAVAGMSIEQSMLGAAHAAANPLTARFGVTHGSAVGAMLPAVVRFNGRDAVIAEQYRALSGLSPDELAGRLEALLDAAGLPRTLAVHGVKETDIAALAADAAEQWTGTFNPRPVGQDEFAALYREVLG